MNPNEPNDHLASLRLPDSVVRSNLPAAHSLWRHAVIGVAGLLISLGAQAANKAPVAHLTGPAAGAVYLSPATIVFTANASDPDGSVDKVVFYANGTRLASDYGTPYKYTWSDVPAGTYTLYATATDNQNRTAASASITVTVVKPNPSAGYPNTSGAGASTATTQNLVPGKIPTNFSVAASGAATYTIPIQVPPGVAGVEPKFSLNYSSQAGNGIAGMGWSLAGTSSITRCPPSMITDGVSGGVNHDTNDRFCLDGQRLIVISDTYGTAASEYRTETDNFSKVLANGTAAGNAANGPESFTVYTQSGLILEYGQTEDSRIEAQGKAVVATWALNKMSDAKGNFVSYSYTEDNATGQSRISSAAYAGRSVKFAYENRPDVSLEFESGAKVSQLVRLKEVSTLIDSSLVQKTTLHYSGDSGSLASKLSQVQVCSADTTCLAPINIQAPAQTSDQFQIRPIYSPGSTYGLSSNNYKYLTGDFNGDGLTDLVHIANGSYVHVWLATPSGQFQVAQRFPAVNGYDVAANSFKYETGDFNGDGLTDLVHFANGNYLIVWISNGDGSFTWKGRYPQTDIYNLGDNSFKFLMGDFDADGRTDMIHFTASGNIYVWFSNGDGTFRITSPWHPNPGVYGVGSNNFNYMVGDFNGDGRADLVHLANSSYFHVWMSNGDGTFAVKARFPEVGSTYGVSSNNYRYLSADINGDGKTDLVHLANAGSLYAWLSKGNGSFSIIPMPTPYAGYNISSNNYNYQTGDFNGDGKDDLIHFYDTSTVRLWLSAGNGTFVMPRGFPEGTSYGVGSNGYNFLSGDFNGDGKTDLLHLAGVAGFYPWISSYSGHPSISSVSQGGDQISISYGHLSGITTPDLYTKDTTATYPLVDLQGPMQVVSSVTQHNGVGGANSSTYRYGGMKAEHVSGPGYGRGNLGFRWMFSKDDATGIVAYNQFSQLGPYVGMSEVNETRKVGLGNADVLKRVTNTFNCYLTNGPLPTTPCVTLGTGQVMFPFVSQTEEDSWDLNGAALPTVRTTKTFAGTNSVSASAVQLGDPTQIQVDILQGGVLKHRKTTVNEFHPANTTGTDWLIGRLKKASVTSTQY